MLEMANTFNWIALGCVVLIIALVLVTIACAFGQLYYMHHKEEVNAKLKNIVNKVKSLTKKERV